MDLLTRAKALKGKGSRVALTVVPFAALTVAAPPSKASTVTFEPGSCVVTVGSGSCSEFQTSPTGGDPVANWISVLSSQITSQLGDINISAGGAASGSFGFPIAILPVAWDFKTTTLGGSGGGSYDLSFFIDTASGENHFGFQGSFGSGTNVETTGSGRFPIINPGSAPDYSIFFSASVTSGELLLTIPGSPTLPTTLDLNPGTTTATPEPSTFVLTGAGIAALLLRRKKTA